MTKKCYHEGEKTAPFLRQKPVKKCLFSSISQEKVEQNKSAKCYRIGASANKVSQRLKKQTTYRILSVAGEGLEPSTSGLESDAPIFMIYE